MGRRKYNDDELLDIEKHTAYVWIELIESATPVQREAGMGWYAVAHEEAVLIAKTVDISVTRAAAIIAVLSPLTRWQGNLDDAWAIVTDEPTHHSLPDNVDKAQRLLANEPISDVLGGRKVRAFWLNISRPTTTRTVVCDSWVAKAIGLAPMDVFATYGVYDAVSRGIRLAADTDEIRGNQAQAIGWLVTRDEYVRGQNSLPNPWGS